VDAVDRSRRAAERHRRAGLLGYLALIAFVLAIAWLGARYFGPDRSRAFDESQLANFMLEVEIPMIDLAELPFGHFRPNGRPKATRDQPRYADEMEVALVQNRNRLLHTAATGRP